jgi:carboxyl-terminal processing protease
VDLRKNGGGSLVEAINLTGLFINQGPVVQVKDSHQRVQLLLDKEVGVAWSGPLVVLTSHMSASASEIFAGAIQDYRRGLLVGDPATHGKGTVQQIMDLNRQLFRTPANSVNLGALKLTVQKFYRPNGETTQLRGVLPDLVLPSIVEAAGHGESKLSFSLPFDKVEAVSFTPYLFTDPELITKLSQQSSQRQQESAAMQALKKKLQRFRLNQQAKTIPLNQQQYVASFADNDLSPSVTRPAAEEEAKGSKPTGPYLTEVLAIASDYFRLLDEAKITIDGKPTE